MQQADRSVEIDFNFFKLLFQIVCFISRIHQIHDARIIDQYINAVKFFLNLFRQLFDIFLFGDITSEDVDQR